MAVAGAAIWLSLHNAATLRCYHAAARDLLAEINITPHVTKMLHGEEIGSCFSFSVLRNLVLSEYAEGTYC